MNKRINLLRLITLLLPLFMFGNAVAQCPSELVSYWKMDETTGYSLAETKNNLNATRNALTGTVAGKIDNSQRFTYTVNGTNNGYTYSEYASIPDNSALDFAVGSSFTISYWCRFTDYAYGFQDHIMVSKGDWNGGGAGPEGMFASGCNGSGKINFLLRDNAGTKIDLEGPTGYGDGQWHHVACVREESTNKNILYVDGVITDQEVYNYTGNFASSLDMYFATLVNGGTRGYFYKGDLDEVSIFNKALSAAEISTIITNAGLGTGICNLTNVAPTINSSPVTTALVGQAYSYDVNASGSTPITYSLATKPTGMTINSSTGVISWTPANITANGLVKVVASNGVAPTDTQSFIINIGEGSACPSNLLVLLKLDEANGPTYADYYAQHNATATVAPTATAGKINGAQQFTATTKLDIPDIASEFDFASNASFSFECWIKTSNTASMVALARNRIDYTTAATWWMGTNTTGKAAFELRDNGTHNVALAGTSTLSDNQWHHIIAVRDGSGNQNRLYVDGVLEASASFTYDNSFIADDPTEINVGWLHRAVAGDPEYHFIGSIDEVAIYNRAITNAEATSFYNGGNPTGHCAVSNFAPVVTSAPVTDAAEDVAYSYTFTVNDINAADVLTLSAVTKPTWLTFNWTAGQKSATLTGTPNSTQVGDHNVTLRVSDQKVQIDQSFVISVANVNTEPEVTSTAITSINEDANYSYTLTVTDEDASDVIAMSVVTKPSWLNFTYTAGAKSAILSGTPDDADVGTSNVDISISDGHHTIHHTYSLTVLAVNDLPVISAQIALNTNEDTEITLQKANFTISDEDNSLSEISLKVQAGTNYTFVGNTVTPATNYNGEISVNVVASDPNHDSQVFHAIVTVNAVNDAPEITSTPILTGYVGNLYAYIFTASDVDDATLTKSVVQIPNWLAFSAQTGVLTGTPAQANKGEHLVILRVSDGKVDVDHDFVIAIDGPDAINDLEAAGIKVFPIPAKDFVEISFENLMEETQVEVISLTGSVAVKATIPASQSNYKLDLGNTESGVYFLRMSNSKINNIGRISIVR